LFEVIAMKLYYAVPLLLLVPLAGPTLADTATSSTSAETCSLVGPLAGATADCQAIRVAYRERISDCMEEKQAEADARAGKATQVTAHSSRARYLICDAESRANLPRVSH
jgi:hypothetical protein